MGLGTICCHFRAEKKSNNESVYRNHNKQGKFGNYSKVKGLITLTTSLMDNVKFIAQHKSKHIL